MILILAHSAWSHVKKFVMEIGDLSKKESMEYLTKNCNINEVDVKKLYELVGGRIVELKTVANNFCLARKSFENKYQMNLHDFALD
jgi:hypothetical protein